MYLHTRITNQFATGTTRKMSQKIVNLYNIYVYVYVHIPIHMCYNCFIILFNKL